MFSNDRSFSCPVIYTDTIHITSNDHSFSCPIIKRDTIHMTSNDHSFGCPIIYTDTIHITSKDHSFGCPIIYTDTIHITSNDRSFDCPIIYTDTIHITSNDHSFDCPIIYTDTIHITSNDRPFGCSIIYVFCYFVPATMHNTVVDPGVSRGTNSRGRCTNLSFCKIFDDNCMKMKDFEPRGGAPSLDPLVLYKPSHSRTRMHSSRMRTTRSSSRWGRGTASSPSTSPLGVSLDQIPLNFPGTSQKTA